MLLPLPSLPPAIIGLSIRHHVCHTNSCSLPNSKPHTLSIHSALRCCCRLSPCSAAARQPLIAAVESSRQLCKSLRQDGTQAQWHDAGIRGRIRAASSPAAEPPAGSKEAACGSCRACLSRQCPPTWVVCALLLLHAVPRLRGVRHAPHHVLPDLLHRRRHVGGAAAASRLVGAGWVQRRGQW